MTKYKTYSIRNDLVSQLETLGIETSMGFNSQTDAIHWAIRQGIEKLEFLKFNRQKMSEGDAVPAEAC